MAQIDLENITKIFGETTALDDVSLSVKDNEFFVLFGPAGAGKTTLLKTIAGIEFPQKGLVKIDGKIVNHIEPMYRNISMVFENYALYPQLNVYDNIAFPMRSKLYRKSEDEIKKAVERVTDMMNIGNLLDRRPSQLSNGQRQRVAIGRCLVREPAAFLMDEPLAHLDAKLRHFMRSELKEMQSSFNSTTIYVTHDYVEAMSLADRIAIVNLGKLVQIGTPSDMFYQPKNEFVAKLFGEPEINLIPAEIHSENGGIFLKALSQDVELPLTDCALQALQQSSVESVDIGIRGKDLVFSFQPQGEDWYHATVFACEPIGNKVILTAVAGDTHIRMVAPNNTRAELDSDIFIKFNTERMLLFNDSTQELITNCGSRRAGSAVKPESAVNQ